MAASCCARAPRHKFAWSEGAPNRGAESAESCLAVPARGEHDLGRSAEESPSLFPLRRTPASPFVEFKLRTVESPTWRDMNCSRRLAAETNLRAPTARPSGAAFNGVTQLRTNPALCFLWHVVHPLKMQSVAKSPPYLGGHTHKVRGGDAARVHLLESRISAHSGSLLPPRGRLPDDTGSGRKLMGFAEAPAGSNGLMGRQDVAFHTEVPFS